MSEIRPIHEIAKEITINWVNINEHAKPYLIAMRSLTLITDMYHLDPADEIVLRFLSNAQHWRGAHARRIKIELNKLIIS